MEEVAIETSIEVNTVSVSEVIQALLATQDHLQNKPVNNIKQEQVIEAYRFEGLPHIILLKEGYKVMKKIMKNTTVEGKLEPGV